MCFLYCPVPQQLNRDLLPVGQHAGPPTPGQSQSPAPHSPTLDVAPMNVLHWAAPEAEASSDDFFYSTEGSPPPPDVPDQASLDEITVYKYIDDTTLVKIKLRPARRNVVGQHTTEELQGYLSAALFVKISTRAADIGMVVNCKKTQLLCVAPCRGTTPLPNPKSRIHIIFYFVWAFGICAKHIIALYMNRSFQYLLSERFFFISGVLTHLVWLIFCFCTFVLLLLCCLVTCLLSFSC